MCTLQYLHLPESSYGKPIIAIGQQHAPVQLMSIYLYYCAAHSVDCVEI
jgi:hypothetical protein